MACVKSSEVQCLLPPLRLALASRSTGQLRWLVRCTAAAITLGSAERKPVQYEPNPKHKPVPTPGRRGSICPTHADADQLLADSVLVGKKRYATDGESAYCAQCHDHVGDRWHGYPVDWNEVPPPLVLDWIKVGAVRRRVVRQAKRRRP